MSELSVRIDEVLSSADLSGLESDESRRHFRQELESAAAALLDLGLSPGEAVLVASKREGTGESPFSTTFAAVARAAAGELLESMSGPTAAEVLPAGVAVELKDAAAAPHSFVVMLCAAAGAALAVKLPSFIGMPFDDPYILRYFLNLSFFVIPFVLVVLSWESKPGRRPLLVAATAMLVALAGINLLPFTPEGQTQVLAGLHLPVALWLVAGAASLGSRWGATDARMSFVRFTGEWLITFVLIILGGGVLSALTLAVFGTVGLDAEAFVTGWMLPMGAAAATVVSTWVVLTQRRVVQGIAPMLARVFTPLFTVLLVALLVGVVTSSGFGQIDRETLITLDALLIVVTALLLYSVSSRSHTEGPSRSDQVLLILVVAALIVDTVALVSIGARLLEYGLSANKLAALGLNLVLLANLGGAAALQVGFLRGTKRVVDLERWQTAFLVVYAGWAAIVALVFPLLFGFA